LSRAYNSTLRSLLPELKNHDLSDFIINQFLSLEKNRPYLDTRSSLSLNTEQYKIYSTLCNVWGKSNEGKYPYFFLTGSAGTGKTFMLLQIITFLQSKKKIYLLMAFTGVAAQNIGGKTIHSCLKIRFQDGNYETLIHINNQDESDLKKIEAILIDEISMVDADLFTFLSNTFARIHKNNLIFGGVPILVVGDLAQLPPIRP
ncbi:14759_t:CDS:1, partial [Acaulospora morrowiae]